jgi:hypothetical protein
MTAPNDQTPWDDYAARVAELYRPLAPGDGYEESEVAAAEARLGFRLPPALRKLYLRAGRRDDIHRAKNHLIAPEELSVEQGALVVYEENQNLVLWGVRVSDLGRDDPPVVRAYNDLSLAYIFSQRQIPLKPRDGKIHIQSHHYKERVEINRQRLNLTPRRRVFAFKMRKPLERCGNHALTAGIIAKAHKITGDRPYAGRIEKCAFLLARDNLPFGLIAD